MIESAGETRGRRKLDDMPTTSEETSSLAGTSVVVHPLVLLSVTDHASRAGVGRGKRVVGVLLGQDNGKTINVANSFAVPFEEDERDGKTWFLDHDYIEGMMEMFKKVNGTLSFAEFLPSTRKDDRLVSHGSETSVVRS